MFKLKPGNVFQKINGMDRKQAYTWGAVVVVAFIALLTLASYIGNADDSSMAGFEAQGYDLAQLPFVNDEAEAYLLSSKYPDMQNNQSSLFYSPKEKEERQEADAEAEGERDPDVDVRDGDFSGHASSDEGGSSSRRFGRGVGRGGSAGGGATSIGQLGSAGSAKAGGSGNSYTWGSNPRGDFRPFSDQDKGSGGMASLQNQDAKKALSQFARGSSAAAGLRDNKGANAKRAMMGGNIKGGEAFGDDGVDLSKLGALALDTNAPVPTSLDLSDLSDKVKDAASKPKDKDPNNKDELSFWEKLGQRFLEGMVDKMVDGLGNLMNQGLDSLFSMGSRNSASRNYGNEFIDKMGTVNKDACKQSYQCMQNFTSMLGSKEKAYNYLTSDQDLNSFMKSNDLSKSDLRRNMKSNGGSISTTTDENGMFIGVTDPNATTYSSGRQNARRRSTQSDTDRYNDDVDRYNEQVREYNRRLDESQRSSNGGGQQRSSGGCVRYSCDLDYVWNSSTCSCEPRLYSF